jgi:iron complex transport system substrate-binding protein
MHTLLLALLFAQAGRINVTDVRGRQLQLPAPPRRIVSLAPAITEICFALGLGQRIVGVTTYCDYPPEASALPKIGDVNTSTEKVLAQKPDLVIAGATANRRAIGDLERLHLKVLVVEPDSLGAVRETVRIIGKAAAAEKQAAQLTAMLLQKEAEARRTAARIRPGIRILAPVQAEPLIVVGGGTFLDDCITLCRGENIGASAGRGYPSLSLELVTARPPDILLCSSRMLDRLRRHPVLGRLAAVRKGTAIDLGPEAARPGPRLAEVALKLARALAGMDR